MESIKYGIHIVYIVDPSTHGYVKMIHMQLYQKRHWVYSPSVHNHNLRKSNGISGAKHSELSIFWVFGRIRCLYKIFETMNNMVFLKNESVKKSRM